MNIDVTSFPDKLNLYPWARFFYEIWPTWTTPFTTLFAGFIYTFVLMWTTGLLLENRWIPYSAQYKGLKYGDIGVGIALTAGTIATLILLPDTTGMWYQEAWLHNIGWGLGVALMLLLKGTEIFFTLARTWAWGRPKNHTMRWAKRKSLNDEGVYTIGQQLSPTSLVHTALILLVTYLTVVIVSATTVELTHGILGDYSVGKKVLAAQLICVMAVGLFVWFVNSVIKDNKERKDYKAGNGGRKVDLSLVHPYNGWLPKLQVFLGLLVAGKRDKLFVWKWYKYYNSFSHARWVPKKQTFVKAKPECVVDDSKRDSDATQVVRVRQQDGEVLVKPLPFDGGVQRPTFGRGPDQPSVAPQNRPLAVPPWIADRQPVDTGTQPHIVQPQSSLPLPPWMTGEETSAPTQGNENSKPAGWVDPPWVKK
ncbi:MAG TPA: hypothetical protein VFO38_05835 [Candidatus Saccharimonadales bacterium]|nr:hypothetical protein [Candidatus Saccharimonadales bacterium]